MDLQVLLQVLWRKKWILIVVPLFAACIAFAVRLFGEWRFKSTAQLATGLTVSDDLIEKSRYLNPYEVQVTFNNLIEIIKSRAVLGQVSYRLIEHDLADSTQAFRKPKREKLNHKVYGDLARYIPKFQELVKQKTETLSLLDPNNIWEKRFQAFIDVYGYDYETLSKELAVSRVNQSDFIELTYTSEHPEMSAFLVNTLCSEFLRYYNSAKDSRSNVSIESLESIAKQRKQYLDNKMDELKNFKMSNDVVNSELESEAKIRQVRDYEDQIADEQKKVRSLELTLANLNVRIADAEARSGLRQNDEIVDLRRKINEVNEKYVQGGQTDSQLLDSLSGLRKRLDLVIRRINDNPKLTAADLNELRNRVEETRIELDIARENLSSLTKVYNTMRYNMGDFASKEAVGKALEKEVEVASQEYLAAQNRLSEAREKIVTNKTSITQILIAEPADKAESRKTMIFMVFSAGLSFVICAFAIVAIEIADTRIKTPKRFKQLTRMKLAGIIPQVSKTDLAFDFVFNSSGKQAQRWINEEIRKIRFEIDSHHARVLLVTSVKNLQGKSFFIMALAFSLSLLKKRVLIIDTNLRNNTLTKLLMAKSNLGLLLDNFSKNTKLLEVDAGGGSGDNMSYDYELITRTQNSFIDIIGNKKSQVSPSEILPGGDFKVLLEWLKVHYDYIILEGPALNLFSDSKELVEFVDLVIPVFSAMSSVNGNDTEAMNYLKSLHGKLGPAVLNNVVPNGV